MIAFLLDLGVSIASGGVSEDGSQIPQDGVQDRFDTNSVRLWSIFGLFAIVYEAKLVS